MAPYTNWRYKGIVKITNPPSVSDVVGVVTLRWYPGMAWDFRDFRVTTIEGIICNYWIEEYTQHVSATIHIKLPPYAKRLIFYYGNALSSSESDATKVFLEFTDASHCSTWTGVTPTVSNGNLIFVIPGSSLATFPISVSYPWIVDAKFKISAATSTNWISVNGGPYVARNTFSGIDAGSTSYLLWTGSYSIIYDPYTKDTFYVHRMVGRASNTYDYYLFTSNRQLLGSKISQPYSYAGQANPVTRIDIGPFSGAAPNATVTLKYISIKRYVSSEPVLTVESKQPNYPCLQKISNFYLAEPQDNSGHLKITPDYEAHQVFSLPTGTIVFSGHVYFRQEDVGVYTGELWIHCDCRIKQFISVPRNTWDSPIIRPVLTHFNYKTLESFVGPSILAANPLYIENKDYVEINNDVKVSAEITPCKDFYDINNIPHATDHTDFKISTRLAGYPNFLDLGNISTVYISDVKEYIGDIFSIPGVSLSLYPAGNTGRHFIAVPSPYNPAHPKIRLQFPTQYTSVSHISPIVARGICFLYLTFVQRGNLGISTAYIFFRYDNAVVHKRILLSDYALVSADLKKSITDVMWELSAEYSGTDFPAEFDSVSHDAIDNDGVTQHLFTGISPSISPTPSCYDSRAKMVAYDYAWYLTTQYLPDEARVIALTAERPTWRDWIIYLIQGTGIIPYKIATVTTANKEFIFNAKTTKREAIDAISNYCGCIFEVKWYNHNTVEEPEWYTAAYWVEIDKIDDPDHGLDLPIIETLHYPDPCLQDKPEISVNPSEKINRVRIRGTDGSGNYFTCTAETTALAAGEEIAREYYEESADYNTQALVDARAADMMDYFLHPPITVHAKLIKRFDLRLFQKVAFDGDFPDILKEVTDGEHGEAYLRIVEIVYHTALADETVEIKAVNSKDLNLLLARAGYSNFNSIDETTKIVDDILTSTILYADVGEIAEISADGSQVTVETESGDTITVRVLQ